MSDGPESAGSDRRSAMSITPPFDRFPYPRQLVVGVFGDEQDLQRALAGLQRSGFGPDRYEVLHGEQDARSLDVTGEAHGLRGSVIRTLQAVSSDDLDHARRHAEHLLAGDHVVAVGVGKDEAAKQRAADALRAAGGAFINYYADDYIESLGGR
jgi:hypothetical protein